ncbi:urease accessory protein UreF [Saccharibacter floricola]|nr:urease accessory UreF family protein [Saccharibacter floricola]
MTEDNTSMHTAIGGHGFLPLLSWVSPAFPTGNYAYSHGLEWAVEQGHIHDVASLCRWLEALIEHGSLKNDLIFLNTAWECAYEDEALADLAAYALACASSRERYEESLWQGEAFLRAASVWQPDCTALRKAFACPLPVAQGLVFRRGKVERLAALQAGGYGAVAALVAAVVKLVPLGQTDGLRALQHMEAILPQAAQRAAHSTLDDVSSLCFAADLAAMQHETQRTRLFRT